MRPEADTVVLGLGTIGSAALYHLAQAGAAPVGVEQFHTVHPFGSSFGHSRGFRTFYHDPLYASLAEASLELWQALEQQAGERLLHLCGWMAFARPGNALFERNLRVIAGTANAYEILSPSAVAARFPRLRLAVGTQACLTPRAGLLDANRCVRAHLSQAERLGATVLEHVRVERLDLAHDHPILETSAGRLRCSRLVVTPGPWAPQVLADLALPLRVTRQEKFYFRPRDGAAYGLEHLPVYVDYDTLFYGFPCYGPGIKVADDNPGPATDPERIERDLDPDARGRLQAWLGDLLPGSDLAYVEGATCMYTLTPDSDFIIGRHPRHPSVVIGAGFSGHGFKFSPVAGRMLAELALNGRTDWPIERFRPDRFAPKPGATGQA